ncbi:OmpA family protein [Sedimentitalea todarodis]|uniref:OmpA family protein n=1 Tax=Sedimentitalea todarodis TaxID=1631240 RepID=A0ABU3VLL3_9RHOB|nr:OmpA family protein [Sedimentitalea todarodis]MDU9007066.1 OmpA family protein [Sedimentitalea todarodis]
MNRISPKSTTAMILCLSIVVQMPQTVAAAGSGTGVQYAQTTMTGLSVADEEALRVLLEQRLLARGKPNVKMSKGDRAKLRKLLKSYSKAQGNPGNTMSPDQMSALATALGLDVASLAEVADEVDAATESEPQQSIPTEQAVQTTATGLTARDETAMRALLEQRFAARGNPDVQMNKADRKELRELLRKYSKVRGNTGNKMSPQEIKSLAFELGVSEEILANVDGDTTAGDSIPELSPEEKAQRRQEKAERRAARQAEREAVREAEAVASAAANGGESVSVTSETITEEDARSAGEEFDTKVGTNTAQADSGSDRVETLGKIALLGLGALAVGKLMNNGDKVVANTGDRVVVERDGEYYVLKDDDTLLRRPGREVQTESYSDGSTRTRVTSADGSTVETIRSATGQMLRRERILADGHRILLFDDTEAFESVKPSDLPEADRTVLDYDQTDKEALRTALLAANSEKLDRRFSLSQVRNIDAVRKLVPEISVGSINFETGSAVIRAIEAKKLASLGDAIKQAIVLNPGELFLIEGHTDAVGGAAFNLALSDRRAESLALALVEYFDVPPENMVIQGYGEGDLRVETEESERINRRAAVRRITQLLKAG